MNDKKYVCGECGFSLNKSDNYCSNCGMPLVNLEDIVVEEDGVYFLETADDFYEKEREKNTNINL
ncbi:MAG: hypothetical protein BHK79_00480 [Halanaerobium sp. MDAL1]|nr:MAG: hypothetical protein BHK79_00480 [Halanaerobium sp. MDAL1]